MSAEAGPMRFLPVEDAPLPTMASARFALSGSKPDYLLRITRSKAAALATRTLALIFSCILLAGCHSQKDNQAPSIEFTKIPPAAQGGRERVDTIAGRVKGYRPGEQIVIYARSGPWWVQPWPDQALIPIQADSTWKTETHLGYEYAALLVDPGYHPPPTMDIQPTPGGSVALVKVVNGLGTLPPLPTVPLHFSGYDWNIQTSQAVRGGLNSLYDADNVWIDATCTSSRGRDSSGKSAAITPCGTTKCSNFSCVCRIISPD